MQSVASLMSYGKSDIGNLDDLDDLEEESHDLGEVSEEGLGEISRLTAQMNAHFSNPFGEDSESSYNPFGND